MDISAKLKEGIGYHQAGALDQAANIYQEILIRNSTHFDALRLLGIICGIRREYLKASELLAKAVRANPTIAVTHANLGMVLLDLGELDKAISACRHALELDPKLVDGHCGLGLALQRKGDFDGALACFNKAIAISPGSVLAHSSLGSIYNLKGDVLRAVHHLRITCHLAPNSEQRFIALARALRTVQFSQSDQRLKQDLLNCFSIEGLRHTDLAVATASVLLLDPELGPLIASAVATNQKLNSTFLSSAVIDILSDPLLLQLLQKCTVPDPVLEKFLTKVRELVLALSLAEDASDSESIERLLPFCYSLAQLCFFNEHLFMENSDETQQLELLHRKVAGLSSHLDKPSTFLVAVYACYRPLYKLANVQQLARLDAGEHHPLFLEIIRRQVHNPLTELAMRSEVPSLVADKDTVTESVQAQYEENPFPRWRNATTRMPGHFAKEINNLLPHVDVSTKLNGDAPEILIAGCGTGIQAIYCSYTYQHARITAVDISLTSLAYAKRMSRELGVENIEFIHANILELEDFDKRFDMIECYGVLHHLSDPPKGLRILTKLLKEEGLMTLGLYSAIARRGVVMSRDLIDQKNYPPTLAGIRQCRQELFSSTEPQIQENVISAGAAFWTVSEVRDLIFHANEHRYTLPDIAENLRLLNLEFLGFTHQMPSEKSRYAAEFPDDEKGVNLDNWHLYEQKYPRTFANMYHFWVRK